MKLKDTGLTKQELFALAADYMIQPYTRFPLIAESGKGQYVYDSDGKEYLDFYAGVAVTSCGHADAEINNAIKQQIDAITHTSNYPYSVPQVMLAQYICEHIGMDKIIFQNSGTEANEAMIKLARKYGVDKYGAHKYEIITALNSFHGRTLGALAATGQPDSALHKGFAPLLEGFKYAEYNNLASFEQAITENTIAIMVEPVQGEGGVYAATAEFLTALRKLCDEKGLLLLLDEIQTGWGRCGALMAYMDYGIKPDAVSMAKAMGNGLPIGAMAATDALAAAFTPGAHGTTYGGNPICCAGSLAAVKKIVGDKLPQKAKELGIYFKEQLAGLPHVKETRGKGLLVGVEFDMPVADKLKMTCVKHGLLITSLGGATIRMVPPLIITKENIDTAIKIIQTALAEIYA